MVFGFHGRYWRFDLGRGRGERVPIPTEVLRAYRGGVIRYYNLERGSSAAGYPTAERPF